MRIATLAAALLVGAALAGCGGKQTGEAGGRFIEQPPVRAIAPADLRELGCDRRLDLADRDAAAELELLEGARVEGVGSGLVVRGGTTAPRLGLAAAEVPPAVEGARAVIRGVRRGKVRMAWFAADGGGTGEIELDPSAGTGALRDHFLFDLAAAGAPADRPLRLELEPTTVAGEIVTVAELCVGRFRAGDERLEAVASVPWKVTIEADTRDALVFPPAGRITRSLELPSGARLELGLGRLLAPGLDTRLRIEAGPPGGAAVTVLDRPVEAAELDSGWLDLVVDLSGVPAGPTELSLLLGEPGRPAPVVAVSAPRVDRPGRRDPRPNIVLISIDTLGAEHLSLYGYERETSPRLDAWARSHAVVFRRAVAPASWTLPSHFSLFTGLDAFAHPANYNSLAIDASAYRFLAQELWRHGYRTQAWTGGTFVTPDYGLSNGFEGFAYWGWKARRDEELETHLAEVGRFLDGEPAAPFFLFFHTYEVHTPNKSREPWYTRWAGAPLGGTVDLTRASPSAAEGFLGTGRFVLRPTGHPADPQDVTGTPIPGDAYDSAIAFVDEKLAPLLERLSEPPWSENTVIAIVSDHGESLLDERRAGHTFPSLDNLMIPMILRLPGGRRPVEQVEAQVRLQDLYPTLLELAGVPVEGEIDGRSLLPLIEGREARGRPAMAYVAPTNWGLVLLTPDDTKVEWRNSPWKPIAGQRLWFAVDGFHESPLAQPPPDGGRSFEALRRAYAERAPGLALDLSAADGPAVDVEVVSDLVDPVSTKAPDPGMPGLDWLDVGRLRASVAPGRPLRLHFEQTVRSEIGMTVRARFPGCRQPVELALAGPIDEFRRARRWTLAPAAGSGCGGDAAPGSGLTLELGWRGPVPTTELKADERLREELRALGYLN